MSINRQMDKECDVYIHMEFYSAIKKSEVMTFTEKWVKMENTVLNKII